MAAMDERQPEPPVTYSENPYTWAQHPKYGLIDGDRLDARTDLRSLDEVVPPPEPPPGGWPDDVCLVSGRPFRPRSLAVRSRVIADNRKGKRRRERRARPRLLCRQTWLVYRRPRERRYRRPRRTRQASRDGPSDCSEGDGEGPPPPTASHVAVWFLPLRPASVAARREIGL